MSCASARWLFFSMQDSYPGKFQRLFFSLSPSLGVSRLAASECRRKGVPVVLKRQANGTVARLEFPCLPQSSCNWHSSPFGFDLGSSGESKHLDEGGSPCRRKALIRGLKRTHRATRREICSKRGTAEGTAIQRDGSPYWTPLPPPPEPEPVPVAVSDAETPTWTSGVWASPVEMRSQIFCNRSLNMKSISAIGFDMDYTLAQYKPDTFEALAYTLTVKQLVTKLGYPEELLKWTFDWRYMVRGLVLDKKRGNILKMDRHKYVKVAYHGFTELTPEERMATYGNSPYRESFDEPDFALIDTLFSLAEAYLFAQLVHYRDLHPGVLPRSSTASYAGIYRDVRDAVDLCHRDGSLKQAVAADPAKYIYKDEQIVPMMKMLRTTGRRTFIVTNSLWDYTHVVMNYLCGKCGTDGGTPRDDKWLELFDVVITGSAKPGFFSDTARAPLFAVDTATGSLRNTDNGSPLVQIGNVGVEMSRAPTSNSSGEEGPSGRVFQGGNFTHLHRVINVESGSQVLYVGDHIYGDILRSKKQLGWRTMLVVPELEKELQMLHRTKGIREQFHVLRQQRDALDDAIQRLQWAAKYDIKNPEELERAEKEITKLTALRDNAREAHRLSQQSLHKQFHAVWGQLMKTGNQNSRFAHQVERFACLYTSHVCNLCYYSPMKSYRTTEDSMPHEVDLLD